MKTTECEYAFEKAVEKFNWKAIEEHMVATNHTWIYSAGVPDIPTMQATCRILFRDCLKSIGDKQYSRCSTGGFIVDIVHWQGSSEVSICFPREQSWQSF